MEELKFGFNNLEMIVLNQYPEFKIKLYSFLQDSINKDHRATKKVTEAWINDIKRKIAENNHVLRDLEIEIENYIPVKGYISKYTIKKNYLLSVNEKLNLLIEDLQFFKDIKPVIISTTKEIPFESLFFKPQMAIEVKRILKVNDYLNDSGQWISSGKLKRIALPYYVLKDEVNEFGFIRSGTESKQLQIWCKEFGINTSYNKGSEPSLKGLLNRPKHDVEKKKDYIEFLILFEPLKKSK